jgi:hypothetical protein
MPSGGIQISMDQYQSYLALQQMAASGALAPAPNTLKDKVAFRKSLKKKGSVNFPPMPSKAGYRYYIADEHLVRSGIYAGWKRMEAAFPDGYGWEQIQTRP